jgi:hypothetical protein
LLADARKFGARGMIGGNMSISFLNLDLDAFLSDVALWISGDDRRDDSYKPWREEELRAFLERQCHLTRSRPVPGRFVVHHDRAFDYWKELVARHQTQIDLVHVDAHADFGLGDRSWINVITRVLHSPVDQRADPCRGSSALNPGSYITYALAARWISSMVYVHHLDYGDDVPVIYFEHNDSSPPNRLQLKAYNSDVISRLEFGAWPPPVGDAVSFEPIVPFTKVAITDFHSHAPFQYALLCQSPGFTPAAADALIPIFDEYIEFDRPWQQVIAETPLKVSK